MITPCLIPRLRSLLFAASLPLLGLALSAQSVSPAKPAPTDADEAILLPAFTIQSETESGYAATNSISATKVATELKKMPVSIDIITEQLFKDYGLTEVYDIVGLSSGVQSTQRAATGNLESYTIRGFTTFFSARNGNTNLRSYDSANVSRVEVVNGPASVLYGQLDPGGVANTITKQPAAKRSSNLRLDLGSWSYYRAELGTTGPLNQSGTLTYRVDGSWTDRDGYRDYDQMKKMFIAPVIRWSPRKGSPTHAWTMTTSYRFSDGWLKGFSTGANISYRGQAKAFETNDVYPYLLDPRVVVNARTGYSAKLFGKPVTYNLTISNLLNEKYYPSSISMGDPTSYRLSAEYRY